MCRFLGYRGEPVFFRDLVTTPSHSLIHQSLHATETKATINGDGFGIGWYAHCEEPGLYREIRPAWSDENLKSLCAQVRSRLFFAHVRASTGTATTRANCHPFKHNSLLFMHNGQIGGFKDIKRHVEALIPDDLYSMRMGTTDSEAIFLAALANGLAEEPVEAIAQTLVSIQRIMADKGISEAFRFTAMFTNGEDIYAFRWASDDKPPTLYYRDYTNDGQGLLIASEPVDGEHRDWHEVPKGCALTAKAGCAVRVDCLKAEMLKAG